MLHISRLTGWVLKPSVYSRYLKSEITCCVSAMLIFFIMFSTIHRNSIFTLFFSRILSCWSWHLTFILVVNPATRSCHNYTILWFQLYHTYRIRAKHIKMSCYRMFRMLFNQKVKHFHFLSSKERKSAPTFHQSTCLLQGRWQVSGPQTSIVIRMKVWFHSSGNSVDNGRRLYMTIVWRLAHVLQVITALLTGVWHW